MQASVERKEILGHPTGLYILFFTEMWERFSYYGMRAILTLFLTASVLDGGLGWSLSEALILYGNYTMMVYLASIPGGFIADKYLGQKKAVMWGGGLLVAGHGVMAVPTLWAFYTALVLIVMGVGFLKPNISTMVGGLYPEGDTRRDKGFTIFYIGINIGAFLAGIAVASVAQFYGWHAGFGLAGIGMLLGQIVYVIGQNHLKGVGDKVNTVLVNANGQQHDIPLTKVEKDRILVLLISFLIVIVFWGAFEQAGGLMNLYAQYKTDRSINFLNFVVPAGWFQSANSFYIILFGTAVAGFWANRALKGKESSTLLKMGVGTMIMGLGFLFMSAAAIESQNSPDGSSAMIWLMLAYLLHTLGELCVSPTALSFITKLAPVKYASLMMGIYFAATGFGNKLAGSLGEAATIEPISIETTYSELVELAPSKNEMGYFSIKINASPEGEDNYALSVEKESKPLLEYIRFSSEEMARLQKSVDDVTEDFGNSFGLIITVNPVEGQEVNDAPGSLYNGSVVIEELENKQQLKIFNIIALFAMSFGLLLVLFFRKLKKLTHGAEDLELGPVKAKRPITSHGETLES